jgi:hypothetical protein
MTRVKYTERQRLRAQDLRGEQDYLLGLAGRHFIGPHAWGIVRGLSVNVTGKTVIVIPGMAIDGYGRELIVRENIEQPLLEDVPGQFVYLFYCERPVGGCGAGPNVRWRDNAEVVIRETSWPIPETESKLALARAAGVIFDGPPWPILLGFLDGNSEPLTSEVRFTRVSAARVASTSKRAIMRIGQENLADRYHFRVSAQNSEGTLRDRFAINLDGNTSIWGNLTLEGSTFEKVIKITREQFIKIDSKSAAAADLRLRLTPGLEGSQRVLKVEFRNKGDLTTAFQQEFKIDNQRSLQTTVRNFNLRNHPVRLAKGKVEAPAEKKDEDFEPKDTFDVLADQESFMERAGAVLKFDVEDDQPTRTFCGCGEEDDIEPELPAGLRFKPVVKAPTALTSRDIYSISIKDAEQTPVEEVRMSGGAFAEGDFTRRLSFAGLAEKISQPCLFVQGNGNIELPGGQRKDDGTAFDMIRVTGTSIYPPVKPDPRDPLFNKLLVFAFIRGVMIFSSSLLDITFPKTPEVIELGKPWEYDLQLHNLSALSALKIKTSFEILKLSAGSLPPTQDFIDIEQLTINETVKKTIKHDKLPDRIKPGKLTIDVTVQMEADNDPVAAAATSREIPVYEPPTIEESSIPGSVEVGGELKFPLTISNGDSEQITITKIQVDALGSAQLPKPQTAVLDPGNSTSTEDATITAAGDDFEVSVIVRFKWTTPPVDSSISIKKTIKVVKTIDPG